MKISVILLPISLILTLFLLHGKICQAAVIKDAGENLTEVERGKRFNLHNSEQDQSSYANINLPSPFLRNNSQTPKPECDGVICPK